MSSRRVLIFDEAEALYDAAAAEIARSAERAIARRDRFILALAGGRTPRPVYDRLARDPCRAMIDWTRVDVYWSDERCVPPMHTDSNYGMTMDVLLSRVPIRPDSVHRVRTELDPNRAAELYDAEIAALSEHVGGGDDDRSGSSRRFDLVLLGLGADGHTASLFSGTRALEVVDRRVVATESPRPPHARITFTIPTINASRKVVFVVRGADKAEAVARALAENPDSASASAARLVRPRDGRLLWFLDRAAAGRL